MVVMTTEVLRNMLYAGSRTLLGLGLRRDGRGALPRRPDARRGVGGGDHPPPGVGGGGLACRATVSNAEEFGEWLATVRGDTTTIVEEQRPVPLYQHVMVGRRMHRPVRRDDGDRGSPAPRGRQGQPRAA